MTEGGAMRPPALIGAAKVPHVPPTEDTILYRLYLPEGIDPAPLVILLPAEGASAAGYGWLANRLAGYGVAVVTYDWAATLTPDVCGLTPGIELSALDAAMDAVMPSAPAIPAILSELERVNPQIGGRIDLTRLILGGHGEGGWLALHNATRRFFLNALGAFAFCPNPLALMERAGHESVSMPVLPSEMPTLMIAASEDGVGARLNAQYGKAGERGAAFLKRMWDRCVGGGHGHAYFMILRGANFTTFTHPTDTLPPDTQPETANGVDLRALAGEIIGAFTTAYASGGMDMSALHRFISKPPALLGETRLK